MGNIFTTYDDELYQRVDELLQFMWDPISVAGIPMARG
jgi:hypothetical protein